MSDIRCSGCGLLGLMRVDKGTVRIMNMGYVRGFITKSCTSGDVHFTCQKCARKKVNLKFARGS